MEGTVIGRTSGASSSLAVVGNALGNACGSAAVIPYRLQQDVTQTHTHRHTLTLRTPRLPGTSPVRPCTHSKMTNSQGCNAQGKTCPPAHTHTHTQTSTQTDRQRHTDRQTDRQQTQTLNIRENTSKLPVQIKSEHGPGNADTEDFHCLVQRTVCCVLGVRSLNVSVLIQCCA